jgi:hypothetical protein
MLTMTNIFGRQVNFCDISQDIVNVYILANAHFFIGDILNQSCLVLFITVIYVEFFGTGGMGAPVVLVIGMIDNW